MLEAVSASTLGPVGFKAQRSLAPSQRKVDQVAAWLVPAVLLAAVLAFAICSFAAPPPRIPFALITAISVPIISCPCALGLARPMCAAIERLKQQGHIVAMAGDGGNDSPALARTDIGVAIGTGADVAMESAGVTFLKGDLTGLIRARKLS